MRVLLFLYPWLELWSLIELGAQTNASLALLWVLLAGVLGVLLIRFAGHHAVAHLQVAQREGRLRQQLLLDDMSLVVVGALLIIPGLLSDVVGLLVLFRPLRGLLVRALLGAGAEHMGAAGADSVAFRSADGSGNPAENPSGPIFRDPRDPSGGVTVEGEYEEVSRAPRPSESQLRPPPDPQ